MAQHQLNILNKLYIGIAIVIALLALYRFLQYQPWSRVYYTSSVTAPFECPVFIKNLQLLDKNGDEIEANFYTSLEQVNNFHGSWGDAGYSYQVGHKLKLPQKLVLNYVSYRDSAFYQDTFALPTEKITAIFAKAKANKTLKPITYRANYTEVHGLSFVVGLANNGGVVVWLRGNNFEETLLKTQLKPIKRVGKAAGPVRKNLDYFKEAFMYLPDTVKTLIVRSKDKPIRYIDSLSRYVP